MQELATINVYKKEDILKKDKTEEKENKKIKEKVDKLNSIEIDENKQKEIVKIIEYEYPYKKSTVIPTKSSVTQLSSKLKSIAGCFFCSLSKSIKSLFIILYASVEILYLSGSHIKQAFHNPILAICNASS